MKLKKDGVMNKNLKFLFLLVIPVFISCFSQPEPVENTPEPQKEENSVSEIQYETREIQEFKVLESVISLPDGRLEGRKTFQYDELGNLLETAQFDGQGELIMRTESLYEGDMKVRENLYDNQGLMSYTTYRYLDGNISEESYFDSMDNFMSGSKFTYRDDGLRESWISLDANNAPILKTRYEYDNGLLKRMNFFTPFDDPEGYVEYTLVGNKWIEEASYNGNGDLEKKTQRTFVGENPVEVVSFFGSRINRVQKNSFDDHGNLIMAEVSNRSGRVLQIEEYKYKEFIKEIQVAVE